MKKILVTGAAGSVGLQVLRFLLSEGKYEITVLELKNKHVYKRLKKFRKRINIVYGDVNDENLIDALVKDHDVVIHLAGVLPPFANVREELAYEIDYKGTANIVNSIKDYNPNCFLLYASSTSVYGVQDNYEDITTKSKCNVPLGDYYSMNKLKAEEFIQENIKNYSIFRIAYVLSNPKNESLIYNVNKNSIVETISSEDAGYAFVRAIDLKTKVNKRIFNLSGGEKYRVPYYVLRNNILRNYGLSVRFLSTWVCAEKNYSCGYYTDGDKLEEILNFRNKNIDLYFDKLSTYKEKKSRLLPRLFALPFISKKKKK